MSVPVYWMALILLTVATAPVVSVIVSTKKSAEQLRRYEADKVAAAEANKALYCGVFSRQADVFSDAVTPTGKAAYGAWLELYRFARCEPAR
jgi:hypothetical protein